MSVVPVPAPSQDDPDHRRPDGHRSRRSFLRSAGGYATGAAVLAVPAVGIAANPAAATAPHPANSVPIKDPTGVPPATPVMAYVHDAKAGTVVIMSGTAQRTVKDRELVRRLTTTTKKKRPRHKTHRSAKATSKRTGY